MSATPASGRYDRHVFICLNERTEQGARPSCGPRGGHEIQARMKLLLKQKGLTATVRANRCLCLDTCELGPSVVVYPDNVWYGHVTPADVDEIVTSHLEGGVPVERLRLGPDELRPRGGS